MKYDLAGEWKKEYEKDADKRSAPENIMFLCPMFEDLGIAEISVFYSGEGDSGYCNKPDAFDANGVAVELPQELSSLLEDLFEHMLDGIDYYNNEGGEGSISVTTATKTICHEDSERVVQLVTTVTVYDPEHVDGEELEAAE